VTEQKTEVAASLRSLGPKWPKTEMDVHFGPRTEVTKDRKD